MLTGKTRLQKMCDVDTDCLLSAYQNRIELVQTALNMAREAVKEHAFAARQAADLSKKKAEDDAAQAKAVADAKLKAAEDAKKKEARYETSMRKYEDVITLRRITGVIGLLVAHGIGRMPLRIVYEDIVSHHLPRLNL